MPRSFTFATITEYRAAKGNNGAIYAELVSSGIKSGSCVSKITATGDTFVDSINPFVTPELGQEGDTLYYSPTEGYRFLRAGDTTWDADSYGQVYINLAKIPSGFSVVAPYTDIFNFKQTDENIGSGKASMTKILGNTVAWNQICKDDEIVVTNSGVNGGAFTNSIPEGHKVYIAFLIKKSSDFSQTATAPRIDLAHGGYTYGGSVSASDIPADNKFYFISGVTASQSNENDMFYYRVGGYQAGSVTFKQQVCVDLTLLYGSAIDGMTDAQILAKFESEFPGYHSYNAGTLLSNKAKAIEFVGFNQWDEEWENGTINTQGQPAANSTQIRSKNYIPVIGGMTYYIKGALQIHQYRADKSYIDNRTFVTNATITLASDASYIKFRSGDGVTTYNHDICISLSGKRNGQYEPYKKTTLQVPITALRGKLNGQGNSVNIFPEGVRYTGYEHDEIGQNYAFKKTTNVNLRSLRWTLKAGTTSIFVASLPSDAKLSKGSNQLLGICSKYVVEPINNIDDQVNDKTLYRRYTSGGSPVIYIKDTAYTDEATFEEALASENVQLIYELAEPEYYVLDREFNWKYRVSEYHTKKMLPENGENPTSAPFACEIKQI